MNWLHILKGGKGLSPTKLNYVEKYGIDEERFYSVDEVLGNLKTRHGGKMSGIFSNLKLRMVLDKLVRQGRAEGRETTKETTTGRSSRPTKEYRLIKKSIIKSNWKTMVDNLVSKDTPFEMIYNNITESMKFNSPSKKEILQYLQENYKQHKLWKNLWSVKNE